MYLAMFTCPFRLGLTWRIKKYDFIKPLSSTESTAVCAADWMQKWAFNKCPSMLALFFYKRCVFSYMSAYALRVRMSAHCTMYVTWSAYHFHGWKQQQLGDLKLCLNVCYLNASNSIAMVVSATFDCCRIQVTINHIAQWIQLSNLKSLWCFKLKSQSVKYFFGLNEWFRYEIQAKSSISFHSQLTKTKNFSMSINTIFCV